VKADRRTQPYRKEGGRTPGPALDAMLKGRDAQGYNPMDLQRSNQRAHATTEHASGRQPRKPREYGRKPREPR
jgi:hypothetical protein